METCPQEAETLDSLCGQPAPEGADVHGDVNLGLQICRANSLSFTRLQLALIRGDRHSALAALDRLHDLDSQLGRLLQRQPPPAHNDPETQAIREYIDEQSMAVSFERLALVSQISGPDILSPTHRWSDPDRAETSHESDLDQPDPPVITRPPFSAKVLGLVLSLLMFTALVGAILFASAA